MLKVITWNCNMAFRKKVRLITRYKPDILVVPECEHPDVLKFDLPEGHFSWHGSNRNKGLGVFSFTGFRIELLDYHDDAFKLIVPLAISNGVDRYTVFAIWANNPQDRGFQYVGQIWKALHAYQDQLAGDKTLLLGDFNSNTIWDKPKREFNHSALVDLLAKKGIRSAYHAYFGAAQGKEAHPTHYLYRHEDKPYHLDYCFASSDLMSRLRKVDVGAFGDWKGVSDHMPLVVEFL